MGIDIAGVLFAIGPLGGVASLEEVVIDLADTAGTGPALAAHVGLEIGHTRLFRLGWGSFLICLTIRSPTILLACSL